MLTLITYMLIGAVAVLFASQNLEAVPVHLIAGRPFDVPLVIIVMISFFAGFAAAILGVIVKAIKGARRKSATTEFSQRRRI